MHGSEQPPLPSVPLTHLWRRVLSYGFRLLYNELAWTYDGVSWLVSRGDWRAWQRAALPFVRGPRVVEIAHGPGHMLLALHAAGHEVMGIDLSAYMVRQAQRRLAHAGVAAPLVRGRAQRLPLASGSVNTLLATFPTDFIVDPLTVTSAHRVLKPDGRFIFVPEGHLTGHTIVDRSIEWLYGVTGQRSGPFATPDGADPTATLPAALVARYTQGGFSLRVELVKLPHSASTVVIAEKSGAS